MTKSIDTSSLTKKLRCVVNTQDSISMFSLWIIHHKNDNKIISNQWLEVLKKSKPSHSLTLLYLCNDVIQNCKRKKAEIFKEAFSDVLPEAIPHLRDKSIISSVQRVFKVWSKRNIFDVDFIDQLHAALLTNRAPDKLKSKLLVEYKPSTLIEMMTSFKRMEDDVSVKQKCLSGTRVDASNLEAIHRLKDKIGGEKFSQEFEESAVQLESFIAQFEKFIEERKKLLELLDKGSVFYHAQYHEAKVVVDAYKSFGQRVNKMKRGMDKVCKKFPAVTKLVMTSDGNVSGAGDDMEMSDSDEELGSKPSNIVAVDVKSLGKTKKPDVVNTSVLKVVTPVIPEKPPSPKKKKVISRPGMRGASFGGSLPSGQGYKTITDVKVEAKNTSLTVSKEINNSNDSVPSPPSGSESPPSPTGSPELNISSPPRLSLESRLADLFSEGSSSQIAAPLDTNTDSDSENETNTRAKNIQQEDAKSLSQRESEGPKDTDARQLPLSTEAANIKPVINFYNANTNSVTPTKITESKSPEKQVIPVIGASNPPVSNIETIQKVIQTLQQQEGDSTPTQDEHLYNKDVTPNTTTPSSSFLSPPPSASDAMSFLTSFLGQAAKATPETPVTQNNQAVSNGNDSRYEEPASTNSMWQQQQQQVPTWTSARLTMSPLRKQSTEGSDPASPVASMPDPIPPPFEEPPPWLTDFTAETSSYNNNAKDQPSSIEDDPIHLFNKAWNNDSAKSNLITVTTKSANPNLHNIPLGGTPSVSSEQKPSMDTDIRMHDSDLYNDNLLFSENDHDQRREVEMPRDRLYNDSDYEKQVMMAFDNKKQQQQGWGDPPVPNRFRPSAPNPRLRDIEADRLNQELRELEELQALQDEVDKVEQMSHRQRFISPNRMPMPRGRGLRPPRPQFNRPGGPRPPYRPPYMQGFRGRARPRFGPRSYYE